MTNKLIIAGIALTLLSFATIYIAGSASDRNREVFAQYKAQHSKQYKSSAEEMYRYAVFCANRQKVILHNATASSYKLAVNKFSDMTFAEFRSKYLMQKPFIRANNVRHTTNTHKRNKIQKRTNINRNKDADVVDWVAAGKVSRVKDQQQCGSCYAFSVTGALESAYAIYRNKSVELSEQELVDCSRDYHNQGCDGGIMDHALNYIQFNKISLETDYVYTAKQGACQAKNFKIKHTVHGYKYLATPDVSGLLLAVAGQPVSAAMEVNDAIMQYAGGVYDSAGGDCGGELNHAVLVVGYDKTAALPFMSIKNSWGVNWGESGYMRMTIGTGQGTCGVGNQYDVIPKLL